MPIFEYYCQTCDQDFELLIKNTQTERPACPDCGGGDLKKQISVFSATSGTKETPCGKPACGSGQCAYQ